MKILISMPDSLVKDIQEICDDEKYERSEFIRMCVRQYIYGSCDFVKDVDYRANEKKTSTIPPEIEEEPSTPPEIPGVVKGAIRCKHGYFLGLCKFGC
jgi:hypothetical protein